MGESFKVLKKTIMPITILFLVLCIIILPAFAVAIAYGNFKIIQNSEVSISIFMDNLKYSLTNPFWSIGEMFRLGQVMDAYINIFKIAIFVYYVPILYFMFKPKKKKPEWEKKEHGSAEWAKKGEQYKVLSKKEGILLAKDNYLPVDKRGNINVLVIGGSGSGKSASFVTPNVTNLLGSYVFTDPKGELYDKTASYFRENGYEIKVLNLIQPQNSDGFNPLLNINTDTDLDIVANTIIKGQGGATGGDEYWDNNAMLLLKAIILLLKEVGYKEEINLASCANLVRLANNSGDFNHLDIMMKELEEEKPGHKARKYYESVKLAADKAYSSILSTLQSKLGKFESIDIAALTATNTIDFKEIGDKKTALFVISPDTHTTYDFLLTIFFAQMIQALYDHADSNGGGLKVPVFFFLDEFANIGQIPDFDKKISTSRSRRISFNVILQNLDQLENLYKDSYETIMANCDTHLFLGSNSQKTAEYFSKQLGEITVWDESVSVSESKGKEEKGKSESKSTNKFSRPLMTPDEIRRLGDDECIIIEKGVKPILAQKYYYFKEPGGRVLLNYTANHNEYKVNRGPWREFDGNMRKNPEDINRELVQQFGGNEKELLGIKSDKNTKGTSKDVRNLGIEDLNNDIYSFSEDAFKEEPRKKEEKKKIIKNLEVNLEKELEKKFDELFGEIEESERTNGK
ncbi:MAG: type IV secretory system conjugative DNA transfer family protein [Clostridiales bacterium]|nr:type IV secretory system conjugative DNA transfer family protein [Clostridiales bacterium]